MFSSQPKSPNTGAVPDQPQPTGSTRWQRMQRAVQPTWISRDMTLIILARTAMSMVRALAGILVPIYLAVIGFNGLELGILFTAVALTSALLSTAVGLLADRFGRKPFLVILPLFAAAAAVIFAVTQVGALIFVFASLGSFGRGAGAGAGQVGPYQPAEQALLADKVPSANRNALFGRLGFASSVGAVLGGPLAGLPALWVGLGWARQGSLASYRPAFLFMAGFSVVAALIVLPVVEVRVRTPQAVAPASTSASATKSPRRRGIQLSRPTWSILVRLWVTNSLNGLAVGFFGPFITYWFYRRYGVGPAEVGALYTVINLAAISSNLGAATIAKRLGIVRAITWSRALQALLMIPMVLAPNFWVAGGFYLLRMLAQRVGLPLRQSYVMGVVPPEERGRVGALANLPSQATSAVSPTFAGYLFDHVSLALPFEIGAFFQAANTVLFYFFFRTLQPPEERKPAPAPQSGSGSELSLGPAEPSEAAERVQR